MRLVITRVSDALRCIGFGYSAACGKVYCTYFDFTASTLEDGGDSVLFHLKRGEDCKRGEYVIATLSIGKKLLREGIAFAEQEIDLYGIEETGGDAIVEFGIKDDSGFPCSNRRLEKVYVGLETEEVEVDEATVYMRFGNESVGVGIFLPKTMYDRLKEVVK